jgi:hypothetical protein
MRLIVAAVFLLLPSFVLAQRSRSRPDGSCLHGWARTWPNTISDDNVLRELMPP